MEERVHKKFGSLLFVVVLVMLAFIAGAACFNLYVDWLFFHEIDLPGVFRTMLLTKVVSGLLFGSVFLLYYIVNVLYANKFRFTLRNLHLFGDTVYPVRTFTVDKPVKVLSVFGGVVISFLISLFGASKWEEILLFINRVNVGMPDPVFGRDLSFFLFTLPLTETARDFFTLTFAITLAVTVASYLLRGGIAVSERSISLDRHVKKHLAFFGVVLFGIAAFSFHINAYKLLYSEQGVIYGAGYADLKAKLITFRIVILLSIVCGITIIAASVKESYRWVIYPAAGAAIIYIGGMVIYGPLLQKFKVAPNELELEKPYIKNNITFTRFGYDLNRVESKPFDVSYDLSAEDIAKNNATIKNIRLWDNNPLLKTYSQLQQIRTYYRFIDVDNDRYTINGEYRQVMLSPRELSYSDLPSKSWINERLVFTHGTGIAMGPVSRITREGLPEFIIKDIPPVSDADIRVSRPEIYYGEIPNDYVIVKTKVQEFNYPTASENVYSTYDGVGGIELSSFLKRTVFAVKFNTAKIFLSSDITPDSRILLYRSIKQRISKVAPFLMYDSDPYMVVSDDGSLSWMIDCYTVSGNLPYSTPMNRHVNYIRNSVKAVIDAYNGNITFYVSDAADVLIKVYSRAFPGLFKPLSAMPEDLRRHIRYPQGMLEVQARMFASYHMTDPKVFYYKEDLWEIPSYSDKPMTPYNTIMKLPGEKQEEYILLIPYTPSKRDNLAAWLAARCDMPNYGKLIAYVFPRDEQFFGPRQINARIDQDAYISQQITLWGQVGSQVIRGSLIIIPIENSLLYVQPLYLSASDRVGLPELRRVIVAFEKSVVMEENLETALNKLFNKGKDFLLGKDSVTAEAPSSPGTIAGEAMKVYEKALELQRKGDWAGYGEKIKELGQLLRQMTE